MSCDQSPELREAIGRTYSEFDGPKIERCLECNKDIPFGTCQQGQLINGVWHSLHVGCADVWWTTLIRVYKVSCNGASYIEEQTGNIADMLADSDEGSEYTITTLEMMRGEYLSLPEFKGF